MNDGPFEERFRALAGFSPYAWQRRLYEELLAGAGHEALDLPTGLGKTSVMALWLLARAAGAPLPRRLIYVVDRRAVVDQATEFANKLGGAIGPEAIGAAAEIRAALGLTGDAVLPISTLRGQFLDNRRWLDDPGAAAIVVGTVDMIGSRLLFSGYGVSRGMRPVHAGLIGVDSLVVIDESHLVPPFEALLRSVEKMAEKDAARLPVQPTRIISLSATGRERDRAGVFSLLKSDEDDAPVAKRLNASKSVRVAEEVPAAKLAEVLAEEAWALRLSPEGEDGRRVVVFCNSRKTAQDVEDRLRKRSQGKDAYGKAASLTELLVGERRFAERQARVGDGARDTVDAAVFNSFRPERHGAEFALPQVETGRPAFLVATSAGEVGIDLDADDLVCDLVPWERMVQRFGRVNRRAEPGVARLVVVPTANDKEAEDEVDAERLKVLERPFEDPHWPEAEDGGLQASPAALVQLKAAAGPVLAAASTPEPLRPPLTRALVDAWSLTSLGEHTGRPQIEPWLRGWIDKEPQTRVVWRTWLPLRGEEVRQGPVRITPELRAYLEDAAPPHFTETVEAPSWRIAELVRERAKALRKATKTPPAASVAQVSDDEDESDEPVVKTPVAVNDDSPRLETPSYAPVVVRLGSDGKVEQVYRAEELETIKAESLTRDLFGATLVVDPRFGGLDKTGLLNKGADERPGTADSPGWPQSLTLASKRKFGFGRAPDRAESWRPYPFRWRLDPEGEDSPELWVQRWVAEPETDEAALAACKQELEVHHRWTGKRAADIARKVGLTTDQARMVCAAAAFHDAGKARPIWQRYAGNRGYRHDAAGEPPLAKFAGRSDFNLLRLGEREIYRHEFGSLMDALSERPPKVSAEAHADLKALPEGDRDLALHLIAAHHGNARPLITGLDDQIRPELTRPVAQDAALRFARLQAQWGPWGLAWWEALLRAGDWAASRELNETGGADEGAEPAPAAALPAAGAVRG